MSIEVKSTAEHLQMCGKTVYGMVDTAIERLRVDVVRITQERGKDPEIQYVVSAIGETPNQFTAAPQHVFNSVDELLTQMAADYNARNAKKPKK